MSGFLARQGQGQTLSQTLTSHLTTASTGQKLSHVGDGSVQGNETLLLRHLATSAAVAALQSALNPTSAVAVTAIPNGTPSMRTAFRILPEADPEGSSPLHYGEAFYLECRLVDGQLGLLSSEKLGLHGGAARFSGKQNVTVVPFALGTGARPPADALWTCVPANPQLRFELEGEVVEANTPVLLRHVRTGNLLAVLQQHVWSSEFGQEFEVVAHTYLDKHKAEGPENLFQLEEEASS